MDDGLAFLKSEDGSTPISIEMLPPNRGIGVNSIHQFIHKLGDWRPAFISVTYHQAFKIEEGSKSVWNRKKPGTLGVCAILKFQYGINVIPHVICGGFSRFESEDFLVDLDYLGLNTILALRGDPRKGDEKFRHHPDGHMHASQLVNQINQLNEGNFLENIKESKPTSFTVGVAGYPEGHKECANLDADINNLRDKVDQGASFIITQMFFDNNLFFQFERKCREAGITVPIIPGIKILSSKRQIELLPEIFHISIPEELRNSILMCNNDSEACELGIEWAIKQGRELIEHGVPCLHIFSMSNASTLVPLLEGIGIHLNT